MARNSRLKQKGTFVGFSSTSRPLPFQATHARAQPGFVWGVFVYFLSVVRISVFCERKRERKWVCVCAISSILHFWLLLREDIGCDLLCCVLLFDLGLSRARNVTFPRVARQKNWVRQPISLRMWSVERILLDVLLFAQFNFGIIPSASHRRTHTHTEPRRRFFLIYSHLSVRIFLRFSLIPPYRLV